ncbi:MAG: histidinol-phosphatase HisJ family protein [Candidatus Cryptobacteroides sp.]
MSLFFDTHCHSQFSFDGKNASIAGSAAGAKANGLGGICFTDHCDFCVPQEKLQQDAERFGEQVGKEVFDIKAQQEEIGRVRKIIPDICIFKGIEIGLGERNREMIRKALSSNSFDQIIGSVHYIGECDPFDGTYYEGKTFKEAYGEYLTILHNELKWMGDFDIAGHFDYVARYAPYPEESVLYKDFSDIFDTLLKLLAEEGKALEINTKTYRTYRNRTPVLDKNILKRFKELGGEYITLGSDSHDTARPGENFSKFAEVVKSCGFRYLTHFENRKAFPVKI